MITRLGISAAALSAAAIGAVALLTPAGRVPAQSAEQPVTVAIDIQPDKTDPMLTIVTPNERPIYDNVEDALVGVDHDGRIKPTIATWTIQDGGHVIEFKLRPGVKFQNGDPLTADDVIFSHQRGMARRPPYRLYHQGINHVEKVDNLTVRYVYDQPNIGVLSQRPLWIGDKAYYDRVGEDEYVAHPIGSGPYRVTDYKIGQYFDLEAWDGYWGGQPQIRKFHIVFVKDDTTAVQMLRAGEADFLFSTPFTEIPRLRQEGFKFVQAVTHPTVAINFQMWNPDTPWAKQPVREAIAHAIDNTAIVKGLFGDFPQHYPLWTPGELAYDPGLKPYAYDPALSKKLLAQAGYPNGFDMPYIYPNSYYGSAETASAVALYLKQVGINAKLQQLDDAQVQALLTKRSKDPTFEFVYQRAMPLANNGDPAVALAFVMAKTSPTSEYKASTPEFDDDIVKALGTLDDAARADLVRKASRIVYDDVGVIALWDMTTVNSMKPEFTYQATQHQFPALNLVDLKRN